MVEALKRFCPSPPAERAGVRVRSLAKINHSFLGARPRLAQSEVLSVLILVLAVTTLGARRVDPISSHQNEVSSEEYAIYDAVISDMFADNKVIFDFGGKVTVKLLVIAQHTLSYPSPGNGNYGRVVLPMAASLHREVLEDYSAKNKLASVLERQFNLKVAYVLVESPESRATARYLEGHAVHGVVTLSRVGFNRARDEAYVCMAYSCGGLCGESFGLFLVKEKGVWRVDKKSLISQS